MCIRDSKYSNHVFSTENAKLGSYPTAEPGEPWLSQKTSGHLQINLRWLCVLVEELLGRSVNKCPLTEKILDKRYQK